MIAELLTANEKKALIPLMEKVIKADGEISDIEKIFFDAYLKNLKMKKIKLNFRDSVQSLCKKFKSHNSKVMCLLELIGVAWADNKLAKEERLLINEVFDYFKIDKSNFSEYSRWAKNSVISDLILFNFFKF